MEEKYALEQNVNLKQNRGMKIFKFLEFSPSLSNKPVQVCKFYFILCLANLKANLNCKLKTACSKLSQQNP